MFDSMRRYVERVLRVEGSTLPAELVGIKRVLNGLVYGKPTREQRLACLIAASCPASAQTSCGALASRLAPPCWLAA